MPCPLPHALGTPTQDGLRSCCLLGQLTCPVVDLDGDPQEGDPISLCMPLGIKTLTHWEAFWGAGEEEGGRLFLQRRRAPRVSKAQPAKGFLLQS